MKNKLLYFTMLTLISLLCCNCFSALAEEITITKTFESNDPNAKYEFEKEFTEDDITYVWQKSSYDVTKKDEEVTIEKFDKKVFVPNLIKADKSVLAQTIVEDDIEFVLQDCTFELQKTDMYEDVIANIKSDWVTSQPAFKEEITTEYTPNYIGANGLLTVTLPLAKIEKEVDYAWRNDLLLTLTVKNYDAEYYIFHGKQFYYNEEQPEIDANTILSYFNLSEENYKINSIEWDGEAYTNSDGISCRNVKITGDRYVAKYVATYTDRVVVGTADRYNANVNYVGEKETPTGVVTYTIEAVATYKKILPTPTPEPTVEPTPEPTVEPTVTPEPTQAPTIEPVPTEIPDEEVPKASPVKPVVITIGIMLLIILIVAVIYTISKKKKRNLGKENKNS